MRHAYPSLGNSLNLTYFKDRQQALRNARENDVRFVRLWFSAILGNLKGFAINVEDLEDAIEQGVGFDGAVIEGFDRTNESDMRAFPDPSTFQLLPWRPRQNAVARMFCDIRTPRGEPFVGDPRFVLKRNLERLSRLGFTYYVGPELDFSTSRTPIHPILWTAAATSTNSPAHPPPICGGTPY